MSARTARAGFGGRRSGRPLALVVGTDLACCSFEVAASRSTSRSAERCGLVKPGLDPEYALLQLSVLWRIKPDASPGGATRFSNSLSMRSSGRPLA